MSNKTDEVVKLEQQFKEYLDLQKQLIEKGLEIMTDPNTMKLAEGDTMGSIWEMDPEIISQILVPYKSSIMNRVATGLWHMSDLWLSCSLYYYYTLGDDRVKQVLDSIYESLPGRVEDIINFDDTTPLKEEGADEKLEELLEKVKEGDELLGYLTYRGTLAFKIVDVHSNHVNTKDTDAFMEVLESVKSNSVIQDLMKETSEKIKNSEIIDGVITESIDQVRELIEKHGGELTPEIEAKLRKMAIEGSTKEEQEALAEEVLSTTSKDNYSLRDAIKGVIK